VGQLGACGLAVVMLCMMPTVFFAHAFVTCFAVVIAFAWAKHEQRRRSFQGSIGGV
jgi:hypothetical protein